MAVNNGDKDWVDQVLKVTNGKGVDLLIDFLASPMVNECLQVTRVGGRMINIGRMAGEEDKFNFDLHSMRRIQYIGASFRIRSPLESLEVIMKAQEALNPTLATDPDAIKPLGRWAIYGYAAGKGLIDPYKHFLKSLTITASSIYTYMFREEAQQAMDFLIDWLNREDNLLSVTKTFRLKEIVQAHHWFEDQHSIGKIAVVMENGFKKEAQET